jgi:hypothetical protein
MQHILPAPLLCEPDPALMHNRQLALETTIAMLEWK